MIPLQIFTFCLAALAPILLAWTQDLVFIEGFVNSLTTLGYSDFAQALLRINGTTVGDEILLALPNGNFTVFVPSNQAFTTFNSTNATAANDTATVANLIAYHILPGNFTQPNATSLTGGNATTNATLISATFPNSTIGRTLLSNNSFVQLEGNKSQVLAWTIFPSNTSNLTNPTILNQPGVPNITVFNTTTFENLLLAFVTGVFNPPQNLSTVLANNNLTTWTTVLNATTFTNSSGVNTTIVSTLEAQRGYTAFIPSNAALSKFDLGTLEGNITNLATVVRNHIINDTTAYSPILFNQTLNFTSAAGEPFTFVSNSSGNFVTVGVTIGNASARIIEADVLVSNGVLHVIDAPLNVTAANPGAATSAFSSASSAASLSTSATGPIGSVFTSSTSFSPTSTSSSSSGSLTTVMVTV